MKKFIKLSALSILFFCLVTGCSERPPAENSTSQQQSENQEQSKTEKSRESESDQPKLTEKEEVLAEAEINNESKRQPTVKDAEEFIKSRLSIIATANKPGEVSTWSASFNKMDANEWRWNELSGGSANYQATVKTEEYFVNPIELTYPVMVEQSSVKFECATTKCIKVKIMGLSGATFDSEKQEFNYDDERSTNLWYFKSEDDAKRVAKAMNFLLKSYGVEERVF